MWCCDAVPPPYVWCSVPACFAFSRDGWTLLSGGRDQVVHVYDLKAMALQKTVPVFEQIEGIQVLTDGAGPDSLALEFATAGNKGQLRVWQLTRAGTAKGARVDVTLKRQTTVAALIGGEGECSE